jgi:hypothetical protein
MSSRKDRKLGAISGAAGADSSPESVGRMQSATAVAGRSRQGRETRSSDRQDQPGEPGREDWHDALARQLFYEQIPQAGGFVAYNRGALSVHSSLLNVLLHD